MKRMLSRLTDLLWIGFLIAALAGGAILFAEFTHDTHRATFIFRPE